MLSALGEEAWGAGFSLSKKLSESIFKHWCRQCLSWRKWNYPHRSCISPIKKTLAFHICEHEAPAIGQMHNEVILKAEHGLVGISLCGTSQSRKERFVFLLIVTWAPRSHGSLLSQSWQPQQSSRGADTAPVWLGAGVLQLKAQEEEGSCLFSHWAQPQAPKPWMVPSLWCRRQRGRGTWSFDPTGIFFTSGRPSKSSTSKTRTRKYISF